MIAGAGILGMLTAELLNRYQGCEVTVIDPLRDKERYFDTDAVRFYTRPTDALNYGEFDAAVDASASVAGLQSCIEAVGFEGKVIVASWFGDREVVLNLGRAFHRKRLKLISSQVSHIGRDLGPLWSKKRRMDLTLRTVLELQRRDLITARFSFSQALDAFTLINTPSESFGLVALESEE
jgi:threonine dehydrogenase-like Zn-dependent dehydrogenase